MTATSNHDAARTGLSRRITRSMGAGGEGHSNTKPKATSATGGLIKRSSTATQSTGSKPKAQRRDNTDDKISEFYQQPHFARLANDADARNKEKKPRARQPQSETRFGLIQESLAHSLYALVVQAILWNQTGGKQARPVLDQLLAAYPNPQTLATAEFSDVATMLYPIGLYNSRAKRLLDMAQTWLRQPPVPGRGYTKTRDRKYPSVTPSVVNEVTKGDGKEVKKEALEQVSIDQPTTNVNFWEIAHLPGVGPYALDSFRIFHRDEMRGLADDWLGSGALADFEPEWKRVVPLDKELRAYLKWRWLTEGWDWDWETGRRKSIDRIAQSG